MGETPGWGRMPAGSRSAGAGQAGRRGATEDSLRFALGGCQWYKQKQDFEEALGSRFLPGTFCVGRDRAPQERPFRRRKAREARPRGDRRRSPLPQRAWERYASMYGAPQTIPHNGVVTGPGFSARVPRDYLVIPAWRPEPTGLIGALLGQQGAPRVTGFGVFPPGASFMPIYPAVASIEAVPPRFVAGLLARLRGLDNPFVAMFSAMALRLQNISNVAPPREVQLPAGTAHVREFEAVGAPPTNQPLRFTLMVIEGAATTVQVMLVINLFRWAEFTGPLMGVVASLSLAGGLPRAGEVLAVADPQHTDQMEINVVGPDSRRIPMTAMPTVVYGTVIVNDHSIKAGAIHGTGIVVGHHSLSKVG